ncbi:hypothetical protein ABZS41_27020, partial [Micromonospora chersina]
QVRAHGRPDDILLLMSTSGTSTNLLTAAQAGHDTGLRCWAFTGPAPNPLADLCHDVLAVPSPDSQVVQELHLVSTHLLCEYVDQALPLIRQLPTASVPAPRAGTFARWAPPPVATRSRDGVDGTTADGNLLAGVGSHNGRNGNSTNGHASNGRPAGGRNGHGSTGTGWVQP